MLQVTDAAASAFKKVLEPPARAIRIEPVSAEDGQTAVTFQPVDAPREGDAPTEASDIDVFVASELAAPLDTAVLDARETPEGTEMFLRSQGE